MFTVGYLQEGSPGLGICVLLTMYCYILVEPFILLLAALFQFRRTLLLLLRLLTVE